MNMKETPSPFTEKDLQTNDGFITYVWGPSLWMTLHTISLNYPCHPTAEQKTQYKQYFDSLGHVLPCGKCRDNLVSNLSCTKYGEDVFESRDTLSRWVYDLHDSVNKMLGKKTPITYDAMRHTYENFRARCSLQNDMVGGGGGRGGTHKTRRKKRRHEAGCTEPVTGIKSKCILRIVPINTKSPTMRIDRRCVPQAVATKATKAS
jgi:hypothetical protein